MLKGSMVALVTPLKNDRVDEKSLRRLVRFQEKHNTDVLVPCGTTGESATLDYQEHEHVVEIVADEAENAAVMAGSGSNSTHEAIRLTQHAEETGCEYALVITPYYNKPPQRGMYEHYRRIADAVDIDIVVYNVPSRTGINLEPETVIDLSEIPNIVGVKEASGVVGQAAEIARQTGEDFSVLSGDDSLTLPLLSVGGKGVVSVLANVLPEKISDLVKAWHKGNPVKARRIHQELLPLMDAMFWETNPIPVKAAVSMRGLCRNELRLPMTELSTEKLSALRDLLAEKGVDLDEQQSSKDA